MEATAATRIVTDVDRRPNIHRPTKAPASAASTMASTSEERLDVTVD
jgi:hypothetical protein